MLRANVEYSTLEKKLASDLALEKATAKKLEVEAASVEKTLQQMVSEYQIKVTLLRGINVPINVSGF